MSLTEAVEVLQEILAELSGEQELTGLDPDQAFEMGFSLAITELERLATKETEHMTEEQITRPGGKSLVHYQSTPPGARDENVLLPGDVWVDNSLDPQTGLPVNRMHQWNGTTWERVIAPGSIEANYLPVGTLRADQIKGVQITADPITAPSYLDGTVILPSDKDVLRAISRRIGEGNTLKGFREEGEQLRSILNKAKVVGECNGLPEEFWQARYDDYVSKRILLVVSELIEAFEEVRSGKGFETYYSGGMEDVTGRGERFESMLPSSSPTDDKNRPRKPEGLPSELIDAVIRLFDLFDEFEIDLGLIFEIKSAYNATRGYRHGRKF